MNSGQKFLEKRLSLVGAIRLSMMYIIKPRGSSILIAVLGLKIWVALD